jgi:hypothetical protein
MGAIRRRGMAWGASGDRNPRRKMSTSEGFFDAAGTWEHLFQMENDGK